MYFNAIRENKILTKNSDFTVTRSHVNFLFLSTNSEVGKVSTNFAAAKNGKVGSNFSAAKNGQVSSSSKKR